MRIFVLAAAMALFAQPAFAHHKLNHPDFPRPAAVAQAIEQLEKAAANWRAYRDYQERRKPGLERRYRLARDYVRAAEDEQTGTPS